MSLSVEQVRQMREQIKANDAAKTAAQKKTTTQTAKTTPAAPAAKSAGTGLSVAQVAQIRSQMTAAPASTSRLQTTPSTPAWTGGARQVLGTVSADTLGKQVLADMTSDTGSPVATDRQEDYEPDWNYVGSDNAPKQRAIAQGIYGSYAKAAQKVGNALAKDRQTDRFDELNQWMDADPRHREVVNLLRQKEYTTQEDKGVAPEQAVQVTGTKQRYSPGDLLKMGYTAQEINEARAYIREYDALPVTDRAVRRTADTTKGIAATVASAVPMAGEMTAQGVKDIRATQKNEAALDKELEGDARGKELKDRITAVNMDYNPQYTDEDLRGMGYSQSEIDEMRSRIAGTVQKTALDKDTSLGYQLYHYGQQRTEAAQAGMSPAAKTAMGVATSAAENLAVAGVSPYLVLPVLSAQGAAESMGQDVEKGTSAGQAVGVGLAKFGAGWAINSVGVADMARSMGVDYARDTVAGKLADLVRSSKLVSGLGNSQLAANTISGGVDNAVQAFVETYADKIIDATLGGDQQAADELLQSDTFLQALQSGLTGGASGALGGAVGTGLGAMSRTLDARAGMETAAPVQVDTESRAADAAAAQRALEEQAMEPGEAARQQADQAAAVQQTDNANAAETTAQKDAAPAVRSENPAVQQLAAAMEADALTGKTINLFTPNAANAANRAAFAEEYGMELPATASETRKALRTLAQQQTAEQAMRQEAEAPGTNVGNKAAQVKNPAADQRQSTVEKAGETVESGQGYSVSMSNDTMTVRFADGTEAVRTVDPENPRTMLFDPEQLHQQAQAESRAAAQQEAQETTQQSREAPDGLRRTVGLRQQTLTEKQRAVQRTLTDWKVSKGAAETISRMVPDSIADLERYTAAASSMYRMGQMDGVKTFDKALELAGGMNNLAPNTNYVLQQPGGEQALRAAFLQGQGEVEAGTVERGALGGALTDQSTKGEGRVIWKGSDRAADDVAAQVIRLNAAGTGTDAILKSVLLGPDGSPSERVKAYADTETGRIFFGDRNGDVFGTVLHEDYHWYNALDAEGAKAVQNTALEYLAKSEGFENVDELIRDKVKDYAAQGLTYEQAAEELVADSWRGIFDSAESVTRWAEFQRAQAEKNAGKAGTIHKVMTAVKEMLNGIISRAKEALTLDPENRAALKAQRLAEAEKRALQDAYFAHAEKAMDNLRAAKENAAALKSEGAAQGVRFKLHEGKDSLVEQMNGHLDELEEMKPVATIEGTEVSFGKTRNENISNVEEFFDSIGNKVIRENFGTVELTKSGARATVQHGNSKAKQVAVAAVPEVIQKGKQIGYEQNWQGRGYDTYVFAAPVEIDGTKLYEGVIVREYTRQNGMKNFYVHEVCWTDGSYVTFDTEGNMTKKEDTPTQLPKAVRSTLADAQEVSSDTTIAQTSVESKKNNAAVQKNVRFQLSAPVEVDGQKDLVAVHNLTEENLREALGLGGMPSPSIAVVKAQEGHTMYGPISLVFGSDTIDPMVNRANRVYGSDAWTPVRPRIEYQVHTDKAMELNSYLAKLSLQTAEGTFARGNVLSGTMDMEASDKSPKQLAEKLAQNPSVKAAYLADIGEPVDIAMKQEERFTASQVRRSEKTIEAVGGEETLRNIIETDRANNNHDLAHTVLEKVRDAEKNWAMEEFGWSEEKAQKKAERVIPPKLLMLLNSAYDYMATEDKSGKLVRDTDAMLKEIQEKAPDADVEAWILPKVEKILGKKGIYNGKELLTRNGNRRSFAQLHNPYTLKNLVEAMSKQNARGEGAWGITPETLMSTATAEYETLDEVRADKGRLRQITDAEHDAELKKVDAQIDDVLQRLRRETTPHTNNSFEEMEILSEILMKAAQGKRTAAAIGKAFAKDGYIIGKDTAQRILKLYNDAAKVPTGYFEAKPQRAVGFDEVRAAILPDNASESLVRQLKDEGVPVKLYKAGDDAARTKLLNEVPNVRFQLAEQASREAKKNDQRQASRDIANTAAALDTLSQFFGVTRGVKVSQDSLDGLAARWTKANASRADRVKLANEARVLVDYLKADGADMTKAQALAETLAGEVLDGATYRNSELWDEYPELHRLEYTVNKNGKAKDELVKQYGSWSAAVAEARSHGVTLRQAEGVRDGNPAEQYESIVNDTRAVGGIQDGVRALWKAAAQQAGVEGVMSMESTEWLDVLMNLHDSIKPEMRSRFADEAEYEDARVELAGRMIEDIMNVPEMTDAQAIFEGMQKQALQMAKAAAGDEARAAEVEKGMQGVQKVQRQEFARRLAANQRTETRSAVKIDGKTFTNLGDVNEYITYQREEFRRQLKQQEQRLKAQRQEDMDAAKLWYKERMGELREENDYLADQVKQEQRRADRAERSLMIQDNEIMEWEAENERRREAWQQKQAQRNAIALEVARQQRDEDIAIAKKVAENRVQRARDARKADELKRSIRANAAQLNQMVLRPQKGKYVQKGLIVEAAEVAKLANLVTLNSKAVNQLTRLQDSITASMGSEGAPNAMTEDWKQSKVPELIQTLREDLTAAKNARLDKLHEQLAQAEALPDSEKARALQDRLKARIADMQELFNQYTTNLINETSMQLLGYNRAGVKNYYPIAVDKSALATQIEGLNLDATIEGRGFLKNRVKKAVQPILLEECSNVVQRSIRDTAAYAGLALPIRDVQKVLNSNVETKDGVYNLKNGIIKEQWGRSAVEYVNDLLTDLQTTQRKRDNGVSRMAARLRGNYAGAILTLNPGVAIAQAASLPTAAAVLGSDTMAAVVPFVKNLSAKQRTVLEAEISEHGDVLLEWRKRGSRRGELASIGKDPTLAEKAMDKLPKALTGWINGVDEVTVAALWEGSKAYVKNHPGEFAEGAAKEGSEDYWQAVNRMYQKVIEQTQPNYTVMQRAGIQRNPDEFVKTFTMFTTQRFQNYGILADAVMDYNAQKARFEEGETEETKAELQRAGKQLRRAAGSQVAQTAVFALMKIGADFLLHRWDREQDENGDVTLKSLLSRFTGLFTESAAGNFLFGSEVYSLVDNALNGKDYDVVSATNISAVNDLAGDVTKFVSELRKDTADMDETKLATHHGKVEKYALTLMEDGLEIAGVPFGNGRKIIEAFKGYVKDAENVASGGKFTFSSLPASATGQYDRLYDAYASGDAGEAQAAMEKLQEMGKEEEAYKQLKTRLAKYDDRVQQAAQAQVNGNDSQRQQLTRQVIRDLYEALGIREGAKADADKREAVIDCVTGAVNKRADEVLKNGGTSVTDDLVAAVDSGRTQDVQEELDRLLRAGKSVTSLKSKITEVCKPEYLAGSEYDRQKLEEMLLALTDGDGNALYEQKTFATWLKNAEKAQTTTVNDPYADLR